MKDTLKEKRCGKFIKLVLFLHDNAPVHWVLATQKNLAYLGFQCLDHTPYSLDLVPPNYQLFPGLKKKQLNGRHFSSDTEVVAAAGPGRTENILNCFEWLAKVRVEGQEVY
jgi:hypothetical protein